MEEKRFTYVVNPRRPIKGILDMPPIKCSMTLKLTKEEALLAMKSGPVYRKFANEGIQERVTATNIDRLHAEKFMTEREFSGSNIPVVNSNVKNVAEENANETPVNIPVPEIKEVKPVETVEIEPDPEPVEEQVQSIQTQSVEEESDETVDTDDVSTSEEISEELSDPAVEDDSDDQEDLEDDNNNQHEQNGSSITVDYNSNRKKKKHRN